MLFLVDYQEKPKPSKTRQNPPILHEMTVRAVELYNLNPRQLPLKQSETFKTSRNVKQLSPICGEQKTQCDKIHPESVVVCLYVVNALYWRYLLKIALWDNVRPTEVNTAPTYLSLTMIENVL